MEQNQVLLLLGANLGNRAETLRMATEFIDSEIGIIQKMSALYESSPWGVVNQPDFLNQVVEIHTHKSAFELLILVQDIEKKLGRVRKEHWGARTIDIDVLYFNQDIFDFPNLKIPHQYLHQRRFTLVPLAECWPYFVHPVLKLTQKELLTNCTDEGLVRKML